MKSIISFLAALAHRFKGIFDRTPAIKQACHNRGQSFQRRSRTRRKATVHNGQEITGMKIEPGQAVKLTPRHYAYLGEDGRCYVARIGSPMKVRPRAVTAKA